MSEQLDGALETERLGQALLSSGGKPRYEDLRRYCLQCRLNMLRPGRPLYHLGTLLIDQYFHSLPNKEAWEILEEVFLAALECGEHAKAQEYLAKMIKKFGSSSARVSRLNGMLLEAKGQFISALEIYNSLLEKDETDSFSMKRKIAIFIGEGKYKAAVSLLNEYLGVFSTDNEAWGELSHLYLRMNMFENAAYCYEELILSDPQNYHYYTKYAEIKYTQGGLENLQTALNYFSSSIELCQENNLTAFYGLILAVDAITARNPNCVILHEGTPVAEWAKAEIKKKYEKAPKDIQEVVFASLEVLETSTLPKSKAPAKVEEKKVIELKKGILPKQKPKKK
uniref:ER membrane protein complex subunit 2 n=1 Tax=Arcella intermedia TaxID=1963864 RepID=A0A6B2L9P1_9EUKA|eukprot:TRINITY_DN810_c0_g1_i1.p1 TRINITY_DN810_c0_g1~~TRINITY_DN810_c0_g1_i1.p1  ORF type:complete len:339 (-),score=89.95 TRINITY_DN810_c0_g1_i1:61-1077(-)